MPCWRDPCPHPCQHSGSPGHGDGGQCQHRCLPAAGLSEAPREGERIAHLPPRLRSSSARSAEGQRDGWTWQSTACGLRPSRVDMSPPTQEDPHAQPHTPPAVVSAPFPGQQPLNPDPSVADTSGSVPNEGSPLHAARLRNTGTAPRGLCLLC